MSDDLPWVPGMVSEAEFDDVLTERDALRRRVAELEKSLGVAVAGKWQAAAQRDTAVRALREARKRIERFAGRYRHALRATVVIDHALAEIEKEHSNE